MQKVDATVRLRLVDKHINLDAKILDLLLDTVRKSIALSGQRAALKKRSLLYIRYRGSAFPLRLRNGRRLPPWRSLSPWMKTQVAGLCLAQGPFLQIRMNLHDALLARLISTGIDPKEYLRDRLMRALRARLEDIPWFYIVIEDRSKDGITEVRPHVHGAIQILPVELPLTRTGAVRARYRRKLVTMAQSEAEFDRGKEIIGEALKAASGNDGKRSNVVGGKLQDANIWTKKPYRALFNDAWVSYAFKNTKLTSQQLPDNRLSISRGLNQEAQRLWNLIRDGEDQLVQWEV